MSSVTFGKAGEKAARKRLLQTGYKILTDNYIAGAGELDIVAFKRGVLIFAEVKTRSGDRYGTPAEAVGEKKIACLRSAASAFIREQCKNGRVRVFYPFGISLKRRYKRTRNDIIEVYADRKTLRISKINHIKDAF